MATSKAVKSTARAILSENRVGSVLACLIPIGTFFLGLLFCSLVGIFARDWVADLLFVLYGLLIFCPIMLGTLRFFWRFSAGVKDPLGAIFYYFGSFLSFKRALSFQLRLGWRLAVSYILLLIPSQVCLAFAGKGVVSLEKVFPESAFLFLFFGSVFLVCGILACIVYTVRFFLAPFLLIADETMSPEDCVCRGYSIVRQTRYPFLTHVASFLGWLLAAAFCLPLPFVAPFLTVSYLVDCRYCVAYYNLCGEKENRNCPTYRVS